MTHVSSVTMVAMHKALSVLSYDSVTAESTVHTKCCGGAGLQLEAKLSGRRQIKCKLYCISLALALLGSCKRFCAFNLKKTHVQQHIKVHLSPLATAKVRVKRIPRLEGKRCSIVRLNPQTRRDWKAKHLQCASFVTLWTRKAMWQMSKAKVEKKKKKRGYETTLTELDAPAAPPSNCQLLFVTNSGRSSADTPLPTPYSGSEPQGHSKRNIGALRALRNVRTYDVNGVQ